MMQWRYSWASATGTSHTVTETPCQDCGLVAMFPGCRPDEEILLLAAADGAGSVPRAKEGADLVCHEFSLLLGLYLARGGTLSDFTVDVAREFVEAIVDRINDLSQNNDCSPRDYSCTMLAAVLGHDMAVFVQVGDGAIVISTPDGYAPVFWPQRGEFVNETQFVTDLNAPEQLAFKKQDGLVDEVAVFTDGLQALALHYETQSAFVPFFLAMFSVLRSQPPGEARELNVDLAQFLDSVQVNERTDDDKTLLLASRVNAYSGD